MSAIVLYASQINKMSYQLTASRSEVDCFKKELLHLKSKMTEVDQSICPLEEPISAVKASTDIQGLKSASLDTMKQKVEDFIDFADRIDSKAAEYVNKAKKDFYKRYSWLKPECEKSLWEKFCDKLQKAWAWCKEKIDCFIGKIAEFGSAVAKCLYSFFETAVSAVKNFYGMICDAVSAIYTSIQSTLEKWKSAWEDLKENCVQAVNEFIDSNEFSEFSFAMHHPFAAAAIGTVIQGKGITNISTNAVRFANAFGFEENDAREGSEVNAVRHTLWILTITLRYGKDTAEEAGNAHEINPHALDGIDWKTAEFDSLSSADEAIDLLNNQQARELAENLDLDGKNMKEVMKAVLDLYHETGLFLAEQDENGKYRIVQKKLEDDRYQEMSQTLETLDKNGFEPGNEHYKEGK